MRLNYSELEPEAPRSIYSMLRYVKSSTLDASIRDVVDIRASQINGCAFCLDMHTQDALSHGQSQQWINCISAWRESPFYTDRERAALELTEALTDLPGNRVAEDTYERIMKEFDEHEYIALVMAINAINCWNRLMIACGAKSGTYVNRDLSEKTSGFYQRQ